MRVFVLIKSIYVLNHSVQFDVEQQTLLVNDQQVRLDAKTSMLLAYFIRNSTRVLSRDELLEQVWSGIVVNDNTVNWTISQLRKALGDKAEAATFIRTIPKKGYQLIAQLEFVESAPSNSQTLKNFPATVNSNRFNIMLLLCLFFISIAILAYWLSADDTPDYRLGNSTVITSLDGLEEGAQLSSDQLLLLFRHKPPVASSRFQLFVKPLKDNLSFDETLADGSIVKDRIQSNRTLAPYPLSDDDFDYRTAIWGVDDFHIYAVRMSEHKESNDSLCEIVLLTLPVTRDKIIDERVLTQCHADGFSTIAYHRQHKALYFTDKRERTNYALYKKDLSYSGEEAEQQLTAPLLPGLGDHFIDLDLVQDNLLILRDSHWSNTQFVRYNIAQQQETLLRDIAAFYYSAFWGIEPNELWHNWGNERVLSYQSENQQSRDLLTSSFGWNYNAKALNENLMVFNVSDSNDGNLVLLQLGEVNTIKTTSTDILPALSPDGEELAFISNQTSIPQIWLKSLHNNSLTQLTTLMQYKEFSALAWSNDGEQLLGVAQGKLGIININQQQYKLISSDDVYAYYPSWTLDNSKVLFTQKHDGQWQLFQVAAEGNQQPAQQLTQQAVKYAQEVNQDDIWFSQEQQLGMYRLSASTGKVTMHWPNFPKKQYWRYHNNAIYFVSSSPVYGLYKTTLDNFHPELVTALEKGVGGQFSVAQNGGVFVFEDRRRLQSNLKISPIIHR